MMKLKKFEIDKFLEKIVQFSYKIVNFKKKSPISSLISKFEIVKFET